MTQISAARRHARNLLIRFGEIMGGGAQQVYEGAGVLLFAVAVSTDGRLLAAVGENGTVMLLDVESGALRQRLEGHSRMYGMLCSIPRACGLPVRVMTSKSSAGRCLQGMNLPEQLKAWETPAKIWTLAISP